MHSPVPPWHPSHRRPATTAAAATGCLLAMLLALASPVPVSAADGTWPQDEYSLEPGDPLTAADRLGPDGFVYPDVSHAGVDGGIPAVSGPVFPVGAPSGAGDSATIQARIDAAGQAGGGVVALEAGTYVLDRGLVFIRNGVVLRGAGAGRTTLSYEYRLNPKQVRFAMPAADGAELWMEDVLEVHAFAGNDELDTITVTVDGKAAWTKTRDTTGDRVFWTQRLVAQLVWQGGLITNGATHSVVATARWLNGDVASATRAIVARSTFRSGERRRNAPTLSGVINVVGDEWTGRSSWVWDLHRSAPRGATTVFIVTTKTSPPSIPPGTRVQMTGRSSDAFDTLVSNTGQKNFPVSQYNVVSGTRAALPAELITAVASTQAVIAVMLERPLRHRYTIGPVTAGGMRPRLSGEGGPITGVGIEDLTSIQPANPGRADRTDELFANTIQMTAARNCWVKGVDVLQTGRNPFALSGCSDIEFRDSRFDQGWWTDVGQGTAYIAFGGGTTDCLLDSIQGIDLRHGPNAQNSANGNVVRNAWLPGLDAQWHMSWAYDNLYESCIIDARRLATRLQPSINTGTYGYAIYAQHGRNSIHGPGGGPRNVVYGCDFLSSTAAMFLGGANERFLIIGNRFRMIGDAPGGVINDYSFNHIIHDNAFRFGYGITGQPLLRFAINTGNRGIRVTDNRIYRSGTAAWLAQGTGVSVSSGNQWLPWETEPAMPQRTVRSIFAWQRGTAQVAMVAPASATVVEAGIPVDLRAELTGPDGTGTVSGAVVRWWYGRTVVATGAVATWVPARPGHKLLQVEAVLSDGRSERSELRQLEVVARAPDLAVDPARIDLWWRADAEDLQLDGSGRVVAWRDKRAGVTLGRDGANTYYPGGLPGLAADPATGPVLVAGAFADKPALRFDAANDGLSTPGLARLGFDVGKGWSRTAVLVLRYASTQTGQVFGAGYNNLIAVDDSGKNGLLVSRMEPAYLPIRSATSVLTRNAVTVLAVSGGPGRTVAYRDGTPVIDTPEEVFHYALGTLKIGSAGFYGRDFRGDLAEVLVFDEALDARTIATLSADLAAYYGGARPSIPGWANGLLDGLGATDLGWAVPAGATAIEVQRRAVDGGWDALAVVAAPGSGWRDGSGGATTATRYRLRARGPAGDSDWLEVVPEGPNQSPMITLPAQAGGPLALP